MAIKYYFFVCSFLCGMSVYAMERGAGQATGQDCELSPYWQAVRAGNVQSVERLLLCGQASVDDEDAEKRTALHIAMAGSDTQRSMSMVRLLLRHRANVERADCYGIVPLDYVNFKSFCVQTVIYNWMQKEIAIVSHALLQAVGHTFPNSVVDIMRSYMLVGDEVMGEDLQDGKGGAPTAPTHRSCVQGQQVRNAGMRVVKAWYQTVLAAVWRVAR